MNKDYLTEQQANMYSPLSLAFLGDSVYDTLVREYLLRQANMPVAKLHSMKIKLVCAEFQAKAFDLLINMVTEREVSILKRGRNATGNTVPKHADVAEYRKSTALESLFGHHFLTGNFNRISELFDIIINADIEIE